MSNNYQIVEPDRDNTSTSNKKSMKNYSGQLSDEKSELRKDIDLLLSSDKNVLTTLENLYKKYTIDMDDITKTNSVDLKRSFDDYMGTVEKNFTLKIDHTDCKKLKALFNNFDDKVTEVEKVYGGNDNKDYEIPYSMSFISKGKNNVKNEKGLNSWESFFIRDELKYDFFYFYTILVKVWLGEHIKKSEIEQIQPCKVLIARSLMKRKFDEEIDMR